MANALAVILFVFIIALVIGLIKPSLVIRWWKPERVSRKKVFFIYGIGCLILLSLIGVTAPEPTEAEKALEAQKQLEKELKEQEKSLQKKQQKEQEKEQQKAQESQEEKLDDETNEPEIVSTDFANFKDEYEKLTDLQKDELWKSIKGKTVRWSAKVDEVDKNKIMLKDKDYIFGGYDFEAKIIEEQKDILSTINKDSIITVEGKLTGRESTFTWWKLEDAKIIR